MIIIQGVFTLEPGDRDTFIAESQETQRISRAEPGCIEYVFAVDPLEANRVVLSERWETRADLDAHLTALFARRKAEAEAGAGATPLAPLTRVVKFFEATETQVM